MRAGAEHRASRRGVGEGARHVRRRVELCHAQRRAVDDRRRRRPTEHRGRGIHGQRHRSGRRDVVQRIGRGEVDTQGVGAGAEHRAGRRGVGEGPRHVRRRVELGHAQGRAVRDRRRRRPTEQRGRGIHGQRHGGGGGGVACGVGRGEVDLQGVAAGSQDGTGCRSIGEGPRHVGRGVELGRVQGCAVGERRRGRPGHHRGCLGHAQPRRGDRGAGRDGRADAIVADRDPCAHELTDIRSRQDVGAGGGAGNVDGMGAAGIIGALPARQNLQGGGAVHRGVAGIVPRTLGDPQRLPKARRASHYRENRVLRWIVARLHGHAHGDQGAVAVPVRHLGNEVIAAVPVRAGRVADGRYPAAAADRSAAVARGTGQRPAQRVAVGIDDLDQGRTPRAWRAVLVHDRTDAGPLGDHRRGVIVNDRQGLCRRRAEGGMRGRAQREGDRLVALIKSVVENGDREVGRQLAGGNDEHGRGESDILAGAGAGLRGAADTAGHSDGQAVGTRQPRGHRDRSDRLADTLRGRRETHRRQRIAGRNKDQGPGLREGGLAIVVGGQITERAGSGRDPDRRRQRAVAAAVVETDAPVLVKDDRHVDGATGAEQRRLPADADRGGRGLVDVDIAGAGVQIVPQRCDPAGHDEFGGRVTVVVHAAADVQEAVAGHGHAAVAGPVEGESKGQRVAPGALVGLPTHGRAAGTESGRVLLDLGVAADGRCVVHQPAAEIVQIDERQSPEGLRDAAHLRDPRVRHDRGIGVQELIPGGVGGEGDLGSRVGGVFPGGREVDRHAIGAGDGGPGVVVDDRNGEPLEYRLRRRLDCDLIGVPGRNQRVGQRAGRGGQSRDARQVDGGLGLGVAGGGIVAVHDQGPEFGRRGGGGGLEVGQDELVGPPGQRLILL